MPPSNDKSWLSPKAIFKSIVGIQDSAHAIALGAAIGMGIGMTPTVGAQTFTVVGLVFLTRRFFHFNRMAALLTIYVSNPLTVVPLYYFLYWVGTFVVPGDVTQEDFARIVDYQGFSGWWESISELFLDVGTPLMIGTAIVAPISGLLTYPIIRGLLYWIRGSDKLAGPVGDQSANTDTNGSVEPTENAQVVVAKPNSEAAEAVEESATAG